MKPTVFFSSQPSEEQRNLNSAFSCLQVGVHDDRYWPHNSGVATTQDQYAV